MHLHLDPVGGIAGDMFAAALLDGWPALGDGLVPALRRAGLADDVDVRWQRVDEVLAGTHFVVDDPRERRGERPAHAAVLRGQAHDGHEHVPYTAVRQRIEQSGLPAGVAARALDVFHHLARAEARVHGVADVDAVVFHEVGAMDSIADVVAAAWLLDGLGVTSCSTAPVPLGSGIVRTAHGPLPIPAPATLALLEGLPVHDDGQPGERVTPTGAAILRHLAPKGRPRGVLGVTGTGWGTKRFAALPNVLRATAIEAAMRDDASLVRDAVARLAFEVDDQSPEDLAVALDHLRASPGVLDVLQAPAVGKKGRLTAQVRVLCAAEREDAVVRACLVETTTLGVRVSRCERVTLARAETTHGGVRTKRVRRPDGSVTTKADIDDVAGLAGAAARTQARRRAEDA